jgi:hypothetical protein
VKEVIRMTARSTLRVPLIAATGAVLALALVAPGLASVAVAQSDAPAD